LVLVNVFRENPTERSSLTSEFQQIFFRPKT